MTVLLNSIRSTKKNRLHILNNREAYYYYYYYYYTDDYGRFTIRSRSGNEYIIIEYHCDSNTILEAPFVNRKYKHRIRPYNYIMRLLSDREHQVYVQILDNKVSEYFKITIVEDWCAVYQLVPPNVHLRNVAGRAIRTFKEHFISAGWSRPYLPQFYVGKPVGSNRAHNQPSLSSHTQPKHFGMGIFQH